MSPVGTVFLFHEQDGRLEERAVSIGLTTLEYAEVTTGLRPGERVVLSADRKGVQDGSPAASASGWPLPGQRSTAPPWILFAAVMVALGTGMLFGFLPARKASRLDPIEALRSE